MSIKTAYSDKLDEKLASIVRAIPCDEHDFFQTRKTGFDKEDAFVSWQEAHKNPHTDLWDVILRSRENNAGMNKQETILSSVCFFDALYSCASYESHQKTIGAHVSDLDEMDSHYETVSKATKQAFDLEGLPHPTAYGRILTDGFFDDDAYDLARQTASTEVVPVSQEEFRGKTLSSVLGNSVSTPATLPEAADSQIAFKNDIEYAINLAKDLKDQFYFAVKVQPGERRSNIFACLSVIGTIVHDLDNKCFLSVEKFNKRKANLDKAAKKLPENSVARNLFLEFSKASEMQLYLGRASKVYEVFKEEGKRPSYLKHGVRLIEKAAKKFDIDDKTKTDLVRSFRAGELPTSSNFIGKNCIAYDDLKTNVAQSYKETHFQVREMEHYNLT